MSLRLLRQWAKSSPLLYFGSALLRNRRFDGSSKGLPLNTNLVIDGFPRCGNTFLSHYVLVTQASIRLGHHFHAPAAVIAAVRRGIPVCVPIRDPLDALPSYLVHRGSRDTAAVLDEYLHYHEVALARADQVVFSSFLSTTRFPERVVQAVAVRFDRELEALPLNPELETLLRKRIMDIEAGSAHLDAMHTLPLPNDARKEMAEGVRKELLLRQGAQLARAQEVYKACLDLAV